MKYFKIIFCLFTITVYSQSIETNEGIIQKINFELASKLDSTFKVDNRGFFINADTARQNYNEFGKIFSDPNGYLLNSIIFIATSGFDKYVFGVLKDSRIIWVSEILFSTFAVGYVGDIMDLNDDNSVEIIFSLNSGAKLEKQSIYIVSYNGTSGAIISEQTSLGETSIHFELDSYEILDMDNDGIYEISFTEFNSSNEGEIYFLNWNGVYYEKIKDEHFDTSYFTIANKINEKVKCKVNYPNNLLNYTYSIENMIDSRQNISSINLNINDDSLEVPFHPNLVHSYYSDISIINFAVFELSDEHIDSIQYWYQEFLNDKNDKLLFVLDEIDKAINGIEPGASLNNISLKSKYLPGIIPYYLQAPKELKKNPNDINLLGQLDIEDLFINSKKGYTIGPVIYNEDLGLIERKIQLLNYCESSFDLGWIKNQSTFDKYNDYLVTAKNALEQNQIDLAKATLESIVQEVDIDSTSNLTSEAYALLKFNTEYLLANLPEESDPALVVSLINSSGDLLENGKLKYYEGGWKDAVDIGDGTFRVVTDKSTVSLRMTYAFGSQTVSNIEAQSNTYSFQTVNTEVRLIDSEGNLITEDAIVKYYSGGWREFGTTTNGVANKELLPNSYSFRMNYAFANKDKKQDLNTDPIVVFQTVNTSVRLNDSQGNPITEEAIVKYYSGGWRNFGTIENGVASKELLPNNYSFRMNYAFANKDKKQDLNTDPVVVFQTVNTSVLLNDSQGNPITEEATVKYYSGGWREFGTTVNGIANKELLPNNYSFRMNYAFAKKDKKQDLNADPIVVFHTVNASVQLNDSQGNPIADEATVKYYSGGWRDFGATVSGVANKELLANNYSFRMNYAFANKDKKQDISADPFVVFQTVNASVQLNDSQGNPITEEATVKYYSGGWREFGAAINGVANKELLPNIYSFRMTHKFISNDKKKDLVSNNEVDFSTIPCVIRALRSDNQLISGAMIKYYSGGWRDVGTTSNGEVAIELLPANLSFRGIYDGISKDVKQDTGTNNIVEIIFE
jgi:hypothetical protein